MSRPGQWIPSGQIAICLNARKPTPEKEREKDDDSLIVIGRNGGE